MWTSLASKPARRSPASTALPVAEILRAWRHGSVIRSWLLDLLEDQFRAHEGGADVSGHVEDTGEVAWLVADALRMERPIPVIAEAVMQLAGSRDRDHTAARMISLMRHAFGGHPLGPDETIADKRQEARVGDIQRGPPR
jgi:6-phosphogluconate dehydrogenase